MYKGVDEVKVAVIGVGHWGKKHVRVYGELADEVVLCDANGSVEVEDYRELLGSDVGAVSIVTPSDTHFCVALDFLTADKDVLVEKPLAMNASEARTLVELADQRKRILMVGHVFRYHPAIIKLKEELHTLGDIKALYACRMGYRDLRKDMGVVYALAIHDIDLFHYLLNKAPTDIKAIGHRTGAIEDTVMISMKMGSTQGYIQASWVLGGMGKIRNFLVEGTKGSRLIDLNIVDGQEPLETELKHFLHCVESRRRPLTDGMSGLKAVATASEVLRRLE